MNISTLPHSSELPAAPRPLYTVRKAPAIARPGTPGASGFWSHADLLAVDAFRPEGSDHRPIVTVRALYDSAALFVRFDVRDRFVRCVHTRYGDLVHKDSCVELFLQPRVLGGYVNIETNCGGTLFCSCIEDPRRVSGGFASWQRVPREHAAGIVVNTNLPPLVDPEISGEVDWWVELTVPIEVLARYVGGVPPRPGDRWRGNFYKCGDETSHPHWGAWSPVGELDFHRPQDFGTLVFEPWRRARAGPPAACIEGTAKAEWRGRPSYSRGRGGEVVMWNGSEGAGLTAQ